MAGTGAFGSVVRVRVDVQVTGKDDPTAERRVEDRQDVRCRAHNGLICVSEHPVQADGERDRRFIGDFDHGERERPGPGASGMQNSTLRSQDGWSGMSGATTDGP